jgi:hypothetical protein
MTKFAHTTPRLDAAARRKAPPMLTYSVEQFRNREQWRDPCGALGTLAFGVGP